MLVVNQYLYLPGCCTFCRSTNLPVIDTQMDLDTINRPDDPNPSANHRMYICADCAVELARQVLEHRHLAFVNIGYKAQVEDMVDSLTESNIELSRKLEETENALRVVRNLTPAPDASPTKKSFKVVTDPNEVEV